MTLRDLLSQQFKVRTRSVENPETDTVGATATKVLGNNPNRVGWTLCNLSGNYVYISFDRDVTMNKGIKLTPNGGTASWLWNEGFESCGWPVYASSTAASKIYIITQEIVG